MIDHARRNQPTAADAVCRRRPRSRRRLKCEPSEIQPARRRTRRSPTSKRNFSEANERALRSHAELENFRKRSQRELADERRYAVVPLVRDLLAVVDNLRAAPSKPAADESRRRLRGLLDGVKMVADAARKRSSSNTSASGSKPSARPSIRTSTRPSPRSPATSIPPAPSPAPPKPATSSTTASSAPPRSLSPPALLHR